MKNKKGERIISQIFCRGAALSAVVVILSAVFFVYGASSSSSSAAAAAAGPETYYVREDGHDGASGKNNTADPVTGAWRHIQKAADEMQPGDTVEVQAGTYGEDNDSDYRDGGFSPTITVSYPPDPPYTYSVPDAMYPLRSRVFIQHSGGPNKPITYHANGKVIIEGTHFDPAAPANRDIDNCFYLFNVEYIIVDGFICQNAQSVGITTGGVLNQHWKYGNGILLDMSRHCTIKNNICRNNNANGISLGRVCGDSSNNIDWNQSRTSCYHNTIEGNRCYDNGSSDLVGRWAAGILLFGRNANDSSGCSHNSIIRNFLYQNWGKGIGVVGGGYDENIKYNVIYNNGKTATPEGAGILFWYHQGSSQTNVEYNTICNNTTDASIGGNVGQTAAGIWGCDTFASNVKIESNIIAFNKRGIVRRNMDFYKDGFGGNDLLFNNAINTIDYGGGSNGSFPNNDFFVDPRFQSQAVDKDGDGVFDWKDSFLLKRRWNNNRTSNVDDLTSPAVDRGDDTGVTPDLKLDIGAHPDLAHDGAVGYPDDPSNLGWADGMWHSWPANFLGSANIKDPISLNWNPRPGNPDWIEQIMLKYQLSYEKQFGVAPGNIVVDESTGYFPSLATFPAGTEFGIQAGWKSQNVLLPSGYPNKCYEGQYRWRCQVFDNVGNGNKSEWVIANNNKVAFGVDVTKPANVTTLNAALNGTTKADLTWTDVDDNPATYKPNTGPGTDPDTGKKYLRESGVASYVVYRSTFDFDASWGGNIVAWQAAVVAAYGQPGWNPGDSKRISSLQPEAHPELNQIAPGASHSFTDGLVDALVTGKAYFYTIVAVDKAGNESDAKPPIDLSPPTGGGDLEYIYAPGSDKPCYADDGAALPSPNELYLDEGAGINLMISNPPDQNKCIGNQHKVRHFAKIKKVAGAFTEQVRFYYTVGTYLVWPFSTTVNTNVDAGPDNFYFKGVMYDDNIDGYKYYYADFPSDIHACGDSPWNVFGVVGVRVSGCQANKNPALDANWIKDKDDKSYTYYVRKTTGCDPNHPGEMNNDVRGKPLKYKWDDSLTTTDFRKYFMMPDGSNPVDNYSLQNKRTVKILPKDNIPDVFYGEIPDIFLRFAYADGDGDNDAQQFTYKCNKGPTGGAIGWTDCNWNVSGSTFPAVDNAANDSFAGGLADPFYGHFHFLKIDHTSTSTEIQDLGTIPESASVDFYFKVEDGNAKKYCYNGGSHETSAQGIAQGTPFRYDVLQDDLSRPEVTSHPQNKQGGIVWEDGGGTWSAGGTYYVQVNIEDKKKDDIPGGIYGNNGFANVISGRSGDSGVYSNSNPVATGTQANPVHDTRVYYKFSATQDDVYIFLPGFGGNNYADDVVITATECGDSSDNYDGVVPLTSPGGNGNGLWTGSFNLNPPSISTKKYVYYRIYACNNDHDPQAYVATSYNTFTSIGNAALVGVHGTGDPLPGNPTDSNVCDLDRDHGWATPTRYGGEITGTGVRKIKITSEAEINGVKKTIVTEVSAEDDKVGNIISHQVK